jgi:hypothetical protein
MTAAPPRPGVERLYTLRDTLALVPLSMRVLRAVVAEIGFRPPPGRKKLLLTERQVKEIQEAVKCRASAEKRSRSGDPVNDTQVSPASTTDGVSSKSTSPASGSKRPAKASSTRRRHDPLLQSILERRKLQAQGTVVRLPDLVRSES